MTKKKYIVVTAFTIVSLLGFWALPELLSFSTAKKKVAKKTPIK